MTPHHKPARKVKAKKPLRRHSRWPRGTSKRKALARKSKRVGVPKYLHPAWKKLRREALRRDGNRCRLRHQGCLGRASTVHHLRYGKGRGVKRLLVDLQYLLSACLPCHRVEDPWIGKGFGKGSRERNAKAAT